MALYKLSFALFPIQDIYARSRDDIARWLHFYNQNPVEVVTKSEALPGGLTDIIKAKKGELRFDFGGIVSGNEYAVQTFPNGALAPVSYVPHDVFEALKCSDISPYEERAEKHIQRLNEALTGCSSFQVLPRVTKKGEFN